jgi:hypothetical protein
MNRRGEIINFILFVLTPLFLGLFIYLVGRSDSVRVVNWFDLNWSISIPVWVNYNLPDGLFAFALMSSIPIIWNIENKQIRFWEIICITFLFAIEFGQLFIISGAFDLMDLLFIFIAILIYYFIKRQTFYIL